VLADLGVIDGEGGSEEEGETAPGIPIIEVWNKWDLLTPMQADELRDVMAQRPDEVIVPLSARTGMGCEFLLETIGATLTSDAKVYTFVIPAADGQRIAFLHARGEVLSEEDAGAGDQGPLLRLQVRLAERELGRFSAL